MPAISTISTLFFKDPEDISHILPACQQDSSSSSSISYRSPLIELKKIQRINML